ncbi:MAG: hypothetical protein HYY18_04415 [Planctomycetes bacterium]|nr:hypothetical protein [Planctomycetota bacterium]
MNRTRGWTLGILVGLLAAGDWFAPDLPADGEQESKLPAWKVEGVEITAVSRDVTVGDAVEKHTFLVLAGDGQGSVKIECRDSRNDLMSRMPPKPEIVWSKEIAFDTKTAREIDLGVLPERAKGKARQLVGIAGEETGFLMAEGSNDFADLLEEVNVEGEVKATAKTVTK